MELAHVTVQCTAVSSSLAFQSQWLRKKCMRTEMVKASHWKRGPWWQLAETWWERCCKPINPQTVSCTYFLHLFASFCKVGHIGICFDQPDVFCKALREPKDKFQETHTWWFCRKDASKNVGSQGGKRPKATADDLEGLERFRKASPKADKRMPRDEPREPRRRGRDSREPRRRESRPRGRPPPPVQRRSDSRSDSRSPPPRKRRQGV